MTWLGVLLLAETLASPPCLVHAPTGLTFAANPGGLPCSGPRVLDADRGEFSVAYKSGQPGRKFTATAFVYRRLPPASAPDEPLEHHLGLVWAEVSRRYQGLACEPWRPRQRPGMRGLRCTGRSAELGPEPVVTFIGLEEVGAWWLKVRATDLAPDGEASERDLESVVAGIEAQAGGGR